MSLAQRALRGLNGKLSHAAQATGLCALEEGLRPKPRRRGDEARVQQLQPSKDEIRVMTPTLIIDADDTLWENNVFYEEAIDAFVDRLSARGISPQIARERIMEVERRNIPVHGYGSRSFAHSLKETIELLTGEPPRAEELRFIDELASTIAEMPIRWLPAVKTTLLGLRERFRMILFTKGNPAEQQDKIDRSGVASYFDHVELTAEKDVKAYTRLIQRYGLDPAQTWMIGNSPRSDINPALQAGLHAILIPHPRTWLLEREQVQPERGDRFRRLGCFKDLLVELGVKELSRAEPP